MTPEGEDLISEAIQAIAGLNFVRQGLIERCRVVLREQVDSAQTAPQKEFADQRAPDPPTARLPIDDEQAEIGDDARVGQELGGTDDASVLECYEGDHTWRGKRGLDALRRPGWPTLRSAKPHDAVNVRSVEPDDVCHALSIAREQGFGLSQRALDEANAVQLRLRVMRRERRHDSVALGVDRVADVVATSALCLAAGQHERCSLLRPIACLSVSPCDYLRHQHVHLHHRRVRRHGHSRRAGCAVCNP